MSFFVARAPNQRFYLLGHIQGPFGEQGLEQHLCRFCSMHPQAA